MLNDRKIRLMTRLAVYEEKEGRSDIKLSTYYKSDYVRLHVVKSIIAVTVGYVFLLLLVLLAKSEYLIAEAIYLDYAKIGKRLLAYYFFILITYIPLCVIGYSVRYTKSRQKLAKYFRMLKRMRILYREEEQQKHSAVTEEALSESLDEKRAISSDGKGERSL